MQRRFVVNIGLVVVSLALLIFVMIVDLFSTHSGLLSAIKSNSDDSTYLFFNQDFLKYHLSLAGWQFAYPTYLLPLLIVNLLAGLFFSGFYVSVVSTIIIGMLFIFFSYWMIDWIFKDSISSKTMLFIFVCLFMSLVCANPVMIQSIPISEYHGGTVLLALIFLGLSMRYLARPTAWSLVFLSLFIVFSIVSDLLFFVSCTLPFALALFLINLQKRDNNYAHLIYALILSTFVGAFSASYLRYLDFSPHAFFIMTVLSMIVALIFTPILWMTKIIDWLQPFWNKIKIFLMVLLGIGILALGFILYSQAAYHFIKLLFDKRIHFGIAGEPKAGYNFLFVIKTMLKDMIFGRPLSATLWLKIYLLIPIFCLIYLIGNKYSLFKKLISSSTGKLIALFLLLSVIIVFFANVFSAGLNTFTLAKNYFNLRYFLIPIFLGTLIIGYCFFKSIHWFFKRALVFIIAITLFSFAYPDTKNINFSVYSNNNPYNSYMSNEIQCLMRYNKKYHLQYGLADHFAAESVNFYLPKSIYINQIVLNTGKIWHVMNNIDWYIYNPNTKKPPIYNFILSNQAWKKYPALARTYGKPDKIINCGDQIYLGIYIKEKSKKKLNKEIYRQARKNQATINFLKKHHLKIKI